MYCVCMMAEDPKECAIFLRGGDHAGWNTINLTTVRESWSKFKDEHEAELMVKAARDAGFETTVELWSKIADMVPKNDSGAYVDCECELCRGDK